MTKARISGTTAASAATDQHVISALWNPSSTVPIWVYEISVWCFAAPGAGAGFLLRRTTTRGTEGSSVTAGAAHNITNAAAAPASGAILGLAAYSAQPTLTTGELCAWVAPAVTACGVLFPFPEGIFVPAGQGLAVVNRAAIAFPTSEHSWAWEE